MEHVKKSYTSQTYLLHTSSFHQYQSKGTIINFIQEIKYTKIEEKKWPFPKIEFPWFCVLIVHKFVFFLSFFLNFCLTFWTAEQNEQAEMNCCMLLSLSERKSVIRNA